MFVPLVKNMLVKELLKTKAHRGIETLPETSTVRSAAQFLRAKKISSVVVLRDGKPSGFITERDVNNAVSDNIDLDSSTLDRVMTPWKEVKTVSLRSTVGDVEREMISMGVRHMPIVDNGDPVDVISMRDINNAYYRNEELIESQKQ